MAGPDLSALGVPLKSDDDDTSALLPMIDHLENSDAAALRMGVPVDQVVSPAGAIGRYQVMPSTGAALGYTEDQLKTPEGNAAAARDVLKQLAHRYGKDPATIAAAYNGGPSRADQIKAGGLDQVPKETADYYSRALKYMAQGAGAVGDAVAPPAQADTGPDLSKFGEPVQDSPAGPDLSGFGEPLKGPAKAGQSGSMIDYVKGMFSGVPGAADTLAREAGQGAIEFGGSLVHGLGEAVRSIGTEYLPSFQQQLQIADAMDKGADPSQFQHVDPKFAAKYAQATPEQRAQGRQQIAANIAALQQQGGAPFATNAKPLAQAGTDITASAPKLIPTTKEQDESLTGKVGKTGGFVAPMILTDVFTGPLGVMAEAGSQGYGDTYDQAKKSGADERTAQQAGLFGGLTQAGLMAVPVHQAVGLVGKLAKPMQNKFLTVVGEMAKSGITFTAFSQLSRLADNVVAKNTYDPNRDLLDGLGDLKDMAAQGIAGTVMPLGGLAGAGAARLARRGKAAAPPPDDGGGPPPGANEPAPMATPPGPDGDAPPAPQAPAGAAAPGLTPIHDPVTWAQTGWRDAAGKVVPLDAAQVPADHDLNAGGAPAPQLVQTVDQAFKAKMAAKFPDEARWTAPEPVKTSILLADAIATGKYNDALHPSNPNARATFEAMTGQTLPRSVAATKALFQGKPFQVLNSVSKNGNETGQVPGFTTNPAKIASEHEAEVSRLAAEGAAAAAKNNPPPGAEPQAPPVEAKKVGKVRGLPVPPQSGPVDLASFLASRGGIRDDEGHDLVKGRGLQQFIPGHGPLIRPGGMSVDDAGEVAYEFGYFGPPGSTDRPTEDDVLQLLEKTGRGADGQRTKVYTPEEEGQGAQAQRENARTDEQNDAVMDEVRAAAKNAGEPMTDDEIHQTAVDMVTHGIDPESAVAEHIERKAIRGVYSDDDEQGPSQTAAQPDQGKSGEADRGSQSGVPESEAGGAEAGGARPAGPAAPENSGQAPPAVERGADGLPQTVLPGAEASAQQAAKARGEKIKPKAAQQDAGGMFEQPKAKEPGLFDQGAKGVEVPDGHEIEPATPVPPREQSQKGGKFTAVARRTKPFSAERGYGDTPEAAQRDALRRLSKGAPQMPVEATGDRTLFRKTISEGNLATVNGTHYGVQEAMPGHWVVRETRDGYTVRTGEPRPDGTGLSRAQAIQKVFEKAFPDASGEEEAGGHITADQARAALASNIDPRTGKRPVGNKALRDFRANMQDVVDRGVSVKQDVARETGLQKDERSRVQPVSEPSGTEAPPLSEMSRRQHERMAENPSPHRGAEGQAEGEGVREGVSPEGETRAPAVPVRGEGGNASRGLREAAGRDVAVPEVPPRGAQDKALADQVKKHLETGEKPMDQKGLSKLADEAYGGTAGEGVHDPRRAYDAMELGVNRYVAAHPDLFDPTADAGEAKKAVERLRALEAKLPIQSRRTGATDAFQQFSTPPAYAYAAVWAGHPDAADVVLEPSAGNGGLATFAKNADAKVVANEISEGRRKNLESLNFAAVTGHDAEQINNLLPKGTTPSLVLMNPPFSNAAQRGGVKDSNITGRHMDQALKALAPGGRLVAITGNNFVEGNTHNRAFFQKWGKEARIRASVEVSGKVFHRYGTSYPTRVIIIDKLPPDGRPAITGSVETPEELIDRLESVRNDRPESQGTIAAADRGGLPAAEQASAEQGGEGASGDERGSRDAVLPPVGGAGPSRSGSQSEPDAAANAGGSPRNAQGGAGAEGNELAGAGGRGRAGVAGRSEGSGDRSGATPGEQVGGDDAGLSANDKPSDVLNYRGGQQATPGEELAGGVYSLYKPQRLVIAGAKPHPAELVQSAAMATVAPPEPTYKPSLDKKVISEGKLSEAQLEPVVYAGQAHSKMLPDGVTRRGFFVGDGTGVGKGREISGVIMDNWNQGRKKAVWISEKWPLFDDAKRDWSGIGGDVKHLINGKKFKQVDQIDAPHGILFSTYDTLKGKPKKGTTGQTRVEQIVKWLGKDFDGVVAFDKAHNMANADAQKGSRGKTLPAEKALAGLELQKQLPNARVLYVSATGATEVNNLGYAERLGLWGPGTSFGTKAQFMAQIEQGGVAAMELVARDLKQMGSYLARGLSFNGVEYGRLEHKLSDGQRSMYDALADSWQMVLQNIDKALEITGAKDDARSKSAAYSAFWGSHQRFFNQILTSMQMPTVLDQAERDMKEGRSPVFQLVNTNEAASERALARMDQDEGSLEDLDLTPRDQLMQMVEHSFPVTAMESYLDENGTKRSRAVMDSQGNAVQDREAVALRDKVLDDLASIKVPDGPLEYLLNKFGPDTIAEVTGRGRRVVERGGKRVVENRPGSANTAEADAFMSGRKKALVFSQAGGTGRSYHADAGAKNQARRVHYLLQPGWSAAPAIQGFGRTHRSNQTSKPLYRLATTDVVGQKRFISSIARRLDQLGALTKGERRSGGQGFFSEKDNLESQYAADAVTRLVTDIIQRKKPMQDAGLTPDVLTQQMGFRSLINPDSGGLNVGKMPDVPQFLNRLLSLRLDMQNKVFDAFDRYFEDNIASAKASGTLDAGVEQLQADHIKSVNEQTVHTDADSGAETKYVSLETKTKNKPRQWDSVKSYLKTEGAFVGEGENGRAYMFLPTRDKTDDRGTVVPQMRRIGPVTETIVPAWAASQKFDKLEGDAAQKAWEKEMARIPEFQTKTQHMITGALLPIWDRLPKGFARVMRAKTDDGKSYLGRVIPEEHLQATLKNLGATGSKIEMAPDQIMQKVKDGDVLTLANGWKLQRRVVAGETRVRLVGPDVWSDRRALENRGVQFERAGYEGMLFVPDNAKGRAFLEQQIKHSPIVSSTGEDESPDTRQNDSNDLGGDTSLERTGAVAPDGTTTQQLLRTSTDKNEILDHIAKNSTDPARRELAKVLKQTVADNIDYRHMRDREAYNEETGNYRGGFYRHEANLFTVHSDLAQDPERAFLHEAVHAATVGAIHARTPIGKQIDRVFNAYQEMAGKYQYKDSGDQYGFRNSKEFVAEILTKPKFREILDQIKAEGPQEKSLLQRFVDLMRRLFKLKPKDPLKYILENEPALRDPKAVLGAAARETLYTGDRKNKKPYEPKFDQDSEDVKREPFYSALTRAIEGVKQDKAPAQQWAGLIDNLPGVRADEVEWSGVKDFLAEQKGPVSKADLLDHVRSNEVRIEEVVKGGDKANPAMEEIQREREAMTNELREWAEKHDHPFMSADELQAEISSRRREVVGDPEAEKDLRDQSRWLTDYIERWEMLDDREDAASRNPGENDTKWSGFTLPGGKDYREMLLTMPQRGVEPRRDGDSASGENWRLWDTRKNDWLRYSDGKLFPSFISEAKARKFAAEGAGDFYKSSHWDEPNILAHVRFDSREEKTPGFVVKNSESGNTSDAFDTREEAEAYQNRLPESVRGQTEIKAVKAGKTKRILHIAEIQSDWHQAGRKRGYKGTEDDVRRAREARDALWPQAREALSKNDMAGFDTATEALTAFGGHPDWRDRWEIDAEDQPIIQKYLDAQKALYQATKGVTDAPFKKNWHELAMKRMLRHAAEHGYDRLSWDTGDTQIKRYPGLERQVDAILYKDNGDGTYRVSAQANGGGRLLGDRMTKADLAEHVGQELADKITKGDGSDENLGANNQPRDMWKKLAGEGLRIGGDGQRGFYDKILPQFVNKYVKKWGAKVERSQLIDSQISRDDAAARMFGKGQKYNDLHPGGKESVDAWLSKQGKEAHSVPITPEMRESVMKGQPMFAHGKGGAGQEPFSPGTRIKDVGGSRKAQMIFRPEFDQMREKVEPALRYWLNKYGLSDLVRLEVPDLMRDAAGNSPRGLYFRDLIAIALSKDPHSYKGKMGHEVIHAVKGLGLIDGPEWKVLADKARADGWQAKYVDSEPKYSELSPEKKVEEAIAHAFPDWEAGKLKSPGNVAQRFFRRLKNVIEAVRNAFKGNGFNSAESVFKKVSSGEIGRRGARPEESDSPDFAHNERDDGEPEKEPDDHTPFWGRVDRSIGQASAATGKRLRTAANKVFPDSIKSAADAVQMAVAPMAAGSEEAMASAKDFANSMREARVFTGKKMDYLAKNFTPDQLKTMWEAADEQSVAMQEGRSVEGIGLSKLAPDERKAVEAFQMESNAILRIAQDIGLFKGEGLPSYVPRMVVAMGADGRYDRIKGGGGDVAHGLDAIGRNLKTTSPNLKHRKYLTTEETEEAANALAPGAMVVKDFRTLPLAMGRLKEAIAGRTLIDNIRAMGRSAGEATVVEGEIPDATDKGGWFTLDHPAFKTYRPKFVRNADTGKVEVMTDQNGDELYERVPVYVRKDFEGPLRAVLSRDTSQIYKAAMSLKGKTMSVIMYSPLMHNAVIWGKAFPTAPIKLMKPLWRDDDGKYHVSIELYGRGRAVKNDPVALRQAVLDGVDPVGHRYFNQDASALMEEPSIKPGRSWTSKIVAYVPGLFDPKAGDAVKRSIDKLGDIWHNKLLWDLVGDLQLGLYQHLKGAAMKAGHDEQTAGRYAAHFANRYAGALPIESMSKIARQTANMLMFSRSFTLTNLGAYKDLTVGLPKDVQAQIARDKGLDALTNIQGAAHRKAASLLAMDIFLSHVGLFMAQYATAYVLHHAFYPPSQNEPDRENRFLIGYQKDGTAIYGRLPTGKVGEELQDWVTEPVDLTKRKLSPFAQVAYGLFSNDQGFGRKIYDPYDKSAMGYVKNLGRVVKYASESVAPIAPFEALFDLNRGHGDPNTNWLKIVAPMVGVTVSKGAPGGPAIGALFASKDEQEFQIGEQMPEIRDEIANGDLKTAVAKMVKLGMTPSYRQFTIRVTKNPGARLTSKQIGQFMRTASPDERAKMENYLRVPKPGQEAGPQAPDLPDDQHSALEPADLGGALKANRLKQFAAAGNTWSRNDAIRAAQAAGLTNTAALLREAGPLSPRLREKVLAETGTG